jgi:ketosteroid isomerase-like protein
MPEPLPAVIDRYFEADAIRDIDAITALFTPDAVVVDEGETRRGTAEIEQWQRGAASKYEYTTRILGTETTGPNTTRVSGRLEGNFPGGTADLKWDFTLAGRFISRLEIAP